MSEVSIIKKEVKKGIQMTVSDFFMMGLGCCAGLNSTESITGLLIFCVLGYFFQKSLQQFFEFLLLFLIASGFQSGAVLYQNGLLVVFFGLMMLFVRMIHASMFHCMPYLVSLVSFLSALVYFSDVYTGLQYALCGFVLMKLCSSEKILIRREFVISEMMMSVMIALIFLFLKNFLSAGQLMFLVVLLMSYCAYTFHSEACIATVGLFYVLMNQDVQLIPWVLCVCVLYFLKSLKGGLFVLFPLVCLIINRSLISGAFGVVIMVIVLNLPERSLLSFLDQNNEDHLLKLRLRNKEQLLQHHLNQFSHVFDLIADYYEDSFLREVQFIKGMSSAMSELSLTMKQCALSQEDEAVHIMELLKGYHYDVLKVYVSHSDTGCLHLVILLNDCLRKDVDDVVLPVLQMNINSNLKLISYRKAQKFSDTVRLEFSSKKPLGIKAKAYRSLDHERTSGDTCAIFQSGNHTICTISDGMGTGVQAEKTSGFVTALTQRLLVCGMPIEMIVRCINSLCSLSQKDQFATLDFLCVDALNHRVILSKNGAAPSYLIRGNETLRIEGHSLPLGIVKEISPDCFQVEIRSKDVFVMCSDGADDVMIQKWLRSRNTAELRQSIEQTLKVHDKKDDITVIVAEIL